MKYIRCPQVHTTGEGPSVFLAGGISNCWDWQSLARTLIENKFLVTIIDPRRDDFDTMNEAMNLEQITWERNHLTIADIILFWFPAETLCPITLFELGFWMPSDKPLVIGCDPMYKRREDVRIQTSLSRPEMKIHSTLDDVINELGKYLMEGK